MENLFELNKNNVIVPNPMVLLMIPFEKIWVRDKTVKKNVALKELTFVWASCSKSDDNIWKEIPEGTERWGILKEDLFGKNTKWKPSKLLVEAIDYYKARIPKTAADRLLESTEIAMDKIGDYIRNVDLLETNANTGTLLHDVKKIHSMSSTMGKMYSDYVALRASIEAGKREESTVRGGGVEGMFEDGNSLAGLF